METRKFLLLAGVILATAFFSGCCELFPPSTDGYYPGYFYDSAETDDPDYNGMVLMSIFGTDVRGFFVTDSGSKSVGFTGTLDRDRLRLTANPDSGCFITGSGLTEGYPGMVYDDYGTLGFEGTLWCPDMVVFWDAYKYDSSEYGGDSGYEQYVTGVSAPASDAQKAATGDVIKRIR